LPQSTQKASAKVSASSSYHDCSKKQQNLSSARIKDGKVGMAANASC
jgi:hypothetical protein